VAEAQLHSKRVKACELALLRDLIDGQSAERLAEGSQFIVLTEDLLQGFQRFDRYKRRAISSRKAAIREWIAILGERRAP
jgi:hypothetical protein